MNNASAVYVFVCWLATGAMRGRNAIPGVV
jgi:hypothetical protein